eukprot:scaffold24_cov341-Pavlova_lutheri.AAC.31
MLEKSIIDDGSLTQEEQFVQHVIDSGGRLVDGGDDGASPVAQGTQGMHQPQSCRRIQSGRWLVQHEQGRIDQQFVSNGTPLPLTSRDPSPQVSTNDGVPTPVESQVENDGLHALYFSSFGHLLRQPEHGREVERLVDGQVLEEDVVLGDKGGPFFELFVERSIVVGDLSVHLEGASTAQDCQQGRLPTPGRSHARQQFSWPGPTRYVVQHLHLLRALLHRAFIPRGSFRRQRNPAVDVFEAQHDPLLRRDASQVRCTALGPFPIHRTEFPAWHVPVLLPSRFHVFHRSRDVPLDRHRREKRRRAPVLDRSTTRRF